MKLNCQKLTSLLSELRQQKRVFDATVEAGKLDEAKGMQLEIEEKIAVLHEEIWDFPELPLPELMKDYVSQLRILEKNKLLERLSSGEIGIKDLDGKEHVFPSFADIKRQLAKNREILRPKMEQGFTKLQITPFGLPFQDIIKSLSESILRHHKEGKIFSPMSDLADSNGQLIPLNVNRSDPIWTLITLYRVDEMGEMVYFPERFEPVVHGGKTKRQVLARQNGPLNGFLVSLIRRDVAMSDLKPELSPGKYLKMLKTDPQLKFEHGLTQEEWVTQFIINLEETDNVIDDWQFGRTCHNLGSYFPSFRSVSRTGWNRGDGRADLGIAGIGTQNSNFGARTAVMIDQPKPKTSLFKKIIRRVTK
ncbi:hypothetical protein EPO05_05115 [Patescibacteria group bacterium]|nr:MAG: hypothetical protein EPO05_05115 [Patescibacteria group bacterium]